MKSLSYLCLDGNFLTGHIPPPLSNCTSLQELSIGFNNLNGPIPLVFGLMKSLSVLYLEVNNLTGHIPASLSNCSSLQYLYLGFNNLTGPIPSALGLMKNLAYQKPSISLLGCQFTHWSYPSHFEQLHLSPNIVYWL